MCTFLILCRYKIVLTYTIKNIIISVQKEKEEHSNELSRKQKNCAGKFTCTSDKLEAEQDTSEAVQGLHCRNRYIQSTKGQYGSDA